MGAESGSGRVGKGCFIVGEVPVEREFLSVAEVAGMLGVPVSTVHHWVARGDAPRSFKVGKHRRFARADVRAWIDSRRAAAS
ncbi:MAG: helix-turn-helix domain-containing protein [Candidatus Phosphoribacter sp.]